MANDKNFLKFVAYLQVIGIILVVFGHSMHEYPVGEVKDLLVFRMCHSFRMPLFMFVSGFLMIHTTRRNAESVSAPGVVRFAGKKLLRLILPFLVLSTITFIPRAFLSGIADDEIPFTFEAFVLSLVDSEKMVIPVYWFLQASFILLVVSYSLIVVFEKLNVGNDAIYLFLIVLFSALFLLPFGFSTLFSLQNVVDLGIYFAFGAAYCNFYDRIDRYIPWCSVVFFLSAVIAWATLFFLVENTDWMAFCSLSGIDMCISFARMWEKSGLGFLDMFIGSNYMIFLLSWFFNVASQQVLHHLVELPWWIYLDNFVCFRCVLPVADSQVSHDPCRQEVGAGSCLSDRSVAEAA